MAAAPTSVTLRMYNVGFGDCFLLTFNYPRTARHMLVDYGSTSAPKHVPKTGKNSNYMERVAKDIEAVCEGKLDVVVATHRHRDHISGFSTAAGTGKIIASLKPRYVIQPWTEDPRAKVNAMSATASVYTSGKADPKQVTAHFLGSLQDMHSVAESITRLAARQDLAGSQTRASAMHWSTSSGSRPAMPPHCASQQRSGATRCADRCRRGASSAVSPRGAG